MTSNFFDFYGFVCIFVLKICTKKLKMHNHLCLSMVNCYGVNFSIVLQQKMVNLIGWKGIQYAYKYHGTQIQRHYRNGQMYVIFSMEFYAKIQSLEIVTAFNMFLFELGSNWIPLDRCDNDSIKRRRVDTSSSTACGRVLFNAVINRLLRF